MHASCESPWHSLAKRTRLGGLLPPQVAFQEHAAHPPRWPGELSSKGSSDTCISDSVSTFLYRAFTAHGALLVWIFNALANVLRGTGNMAIPAIVTCAGAAVLIPVSPCLIFGWGPFPQLGVAGGAVAVVAYYAVGSVALAAYLWSGRSVVRLAWAGLGFRGPLVRDILRVGAVAALVTVQTNLTIAIATGLSDGSGRRRLRATALARGLSTSWSPSSSGWAVPSSPWWGRTSVRASATGRC